MKKLLILCFLWINYTISAQFANDWIDYSKPYFKIEVNTEGFYRINASTLNSVGLNFINSDNFVLFRNGKQVPIYINKTGANVNYIEFYGYANDGEMDSVLYKNPDWQPHKKISLFSNTAVYYLSFNNASTNLRLNETPNLLNNLPAKEEYFYHTVSNVYSNKFSLGKTYYAGAVLYNSLFDEGEGFVSADNLQINNSTTSRTFTINTPHKYNNSNLHANLKTVVLAWSNGGHHFRIKTGTTLLNQFNFNNFKLIKSSDNVNNNLIGNTLPITLEAVNTSTGINRNNIALLELNYPRTFNFSGLDFFNFKIQGNGAVQYLEIDNFNNQSTQPILYDLTNGYRIKAIDAVNSSTFRFALPPSTNQRQLILKTDNNSNVNIVSSLSEKYFTDYSNALHQGDYIILSHPQLNQTTAYTNYVNYRKSVAGGAHQVVSADITELYDQFAYGIDHHASTVRNFIDYATNQWITKPKHLFIIGKGREYNTYRFNTSVRAACLVPTFGHPGSDNLLVADNVSDVPNIAVGRIAATNETQIADYLQKVTEYEAEQNKVGDPYQTVANKSFMKQLVHLGGGGHAAQQNQFKGYLNNYKNIAADTLWGANTYSVFKNNSNPLQNVQSDFLTHKINNGVSLITFFGHSYAGGFDVSIDEPENYSNVGKYPMYLANGCNAGAIHGSSQSISERFIFVPQKGAVAYLSTTSTSLDASLNTFSHLFYKNLATNQYAESIGSLVQATIADVENCCGTSPFQMMVPHEMTLNGDPALKLNQYSKPDYNIEANNVFFTPNNINSSIDSFEVNLIVYNLGKAIDTNINIEVSRILPDGSQSLVNKMVKAPYFIDTISFRFAVQENNVGFGLNQFNIHVDNDDAINNELSETNNILTNQVSLLIGSEDIYPIYPYEFAIVPQQNITLKASTGNAFATAKDYIFQIDTSELFNNPLAENTINSSGGVVNWQPNISFSDSTVYYWRVKAKNNANSNWQYSSFIYLANEYPGWNQSHYYQWQKDNYNNTLIDTDRKFKFVDDVKDIFVRTGHYPHIPYEHMEWQLNNIKMHDWGMNNCSGAGGFGFKRGLSIVAISNITGLPVDIINAGGSLSTVGSIHCNSGQVVTVANFPTVGVTPTFHPTPGVPWSQVMLNYLNNIPNDYYVIVYSINNPQYLAWSSALMNFMNSKGSTVNNSTEAPMILIYQNNNPSFTPISVVGNNFTETITANTSISGVWNSGSIKSTLIGPAQKWGSFHWQYSALENPTQDQQSVAIYGVNSNQQETLLHTITNALDTTLQHIDANIYPYLRLKLNTEDLSNRTPTQLDYWRVLYKKAPEIAINPNLFFEVSKDTLKQGDLFYVKVAVENISTEDMGKLWVKNTHTNANNTIETTLVQNDSLPALDTLHLQYNKNTLNSHFIGKNHLIIEANPYGAHHQTEQFHFNNFALLDYDVLGDKENPLLDVTFDGVHILDGDIVSAKPTIAIQLKDENTFLALDDTTAMDIYIRSLADGSIKRIDYNNPKLSFYPANATNLSKENKALIILKEEFPQDGKYELMVKAKDASGNNSSNTDNRIIDLKYYDYKISFEIINKSTISNVLNYPNPFTTQTHFVFTLTGSVIPDEFHIKIFNIKGTLVKQIPKEELGNLHIGLNKTQYTWNGTDQYGDKLANGVYLYKVYTNIDNQEIEHLNNEQVDKFFTKGFGKMVLIR